MKRERLRKRLLGFLTLAVLMLVVAMLTATPALAAPDEGVAIPITDFLPLDSLITYGGSLVATLLIVQLLKNHIPIETRLLSCLVALAVLNIAALGLQIWNWKFGVWSIFNSVVIGFAASGGYDAYQRLRYGNGKGEDMEPQGGDEELEE